MYKRQLIMSGICVLWDLGTGWRGWSVNIGIPDICLLIQVVTVSYTHLRASAYGKMSIMFPMVTDVKEVQQAKLLLEKINKELQDEKIPFNEEIQIGVMIETCLLYTSQKRHGRTQCPRLVCLVL